MSVCDMTFNSLNKILRALRQQAGWETHQQYHQVLGAWQGLDRQIVLKARPTAIVRNVLWVATASSSWAQTLSLQRHRLLHQLNAELSEPLADMRFSPARWLPGELAIAPLPQGSHPQIRFPSPNRVCPNPHRPVPIPRWRFSAGQRRFKPGRRRFAPVLVAIGPHRRESWPVGGFARSVPPSNGSRRVSNLSEWRSPPRHKKF
ncbi:MAG: DUF721 domain-containing protein [Chloroflexaceae bacterium]|nr:DUF721 domain-containing protein [Chloroflexaceae bacterium]